MTTTTRTGNPPVWFMYKQPTNIPLPIPSLIISLAVSSGCCQRDQEQGEAWPGSPCRGRFEWFGWS